MKKVLSILAGIILCQTSALASHFQGGNITYDCLGGNQYRVTFTQFFDCGTYNVSQAGTTIPITITNDCGLANPSLTLANTVPYLEVSQLCGASLPGSECSGGVQPGVFMAQWSAIVNLPGTCNSWHFSYSTCCWNATTNAPGTPGQCYSTSLNNMPAIGGCDDSPVITGQQIPYICANQTTTYSLGVSDPNGNNLQYQLVAAMDGTYPGTPMAYNAGYSGAAPIPGMVIDPATGLITVTPTVTGNYIIAVNITSYNALGQPIGTIHHQFQIVVINCSNQVPVPPAAGVSGVTPGITGAGDEVTFCSGVNGCFNVVFTDPNAANILTLTSNVAAAMPGATFTVSGTNPATATICWTPGPGAPTNASITITAEDNACPIAGLNSYNVDVNVISTCCLPPTMSSTPSCGAGSNGSVTAQGNGAPNYSYTWTNTGTGATVATHTGMAGASTVSGLPPGNYQVSCTDASGCTTTGTVTVGSNPMPTLNVTNATICSGNSATLTATPNITGGTFLWSTSANTGSITQSPGTTTNYTVSYDLGGCIANGSGTITVNPTPTIAVNSETICNGETANLSSNPSLPGGSFSWTGGLPATQNVSASPSSTTSYTVTYTLATCTATATSTVTVNPVPIVNVNSETICAGNSATLTAVPDVTGGTFAWGGGENTASITVSPAATQTYTIDYSVGGCDAATVTSTVTVVANPVANFSPTMVCQGTSTQFTDMSSPGMDTWTYDFGDGTPVSNLQNPIHTYAAQGVYNAQLTVSESGCTGTATIVVTVNAMPSASFTVTPACPTSNTTFDAAASAIASGTIDDYNWSLTGAGVPSMTGVAPVTTYATGGAYTATLIVISDQGCSDTLVQPVNIPYMPVPDFSFTEVCFGNQNCFTDLSTVTGATITGWTWVWDDGLPVGSTQNPCHTYGAPGTYGVTLIPTTSMGCTGPSVTYNVDVNGLPVADFSVSNVCQLTAAAFNNLSANATIYDWNFGDASAHSAVEDPSHNYSAHNTYNVTLIVSTAAGCSDTVTKPVTIHPEPNAAFTFTSVCEDVAITYNSTSTVAAPGSITTYAWTFGDASTDAVASPTHAYAGDGTYTVGLTVTTADGCTDNVSQSVDIYPLPEIDFTPTDVCLGTATTYTNLTTIPSGSMSSYGWNFGDGGTSSSTNPTHTYAAIGPYNVTLTATSNHGCVSSEVIVVTVHPNPVVVFDVDVNSSCSPLCVELTSTSNIASGSISSLAWDFGDGTGATGTTVNKCYVNTSLAVDRYDITLTATSDFGCVSVLTIPDYLTVYPTPVAQFTAVPQSVSVLTPEVSFFNSSLGASTASWIFGDSLGSTSTQLNPQHEYADPGIYIVTLEVTSVYGCKDTISHPVEILPEFLLFVPNAFTPDGDGKNDVFVPFLEGYEPDSYEWYVFNRWGDLIHQSNYSINPWDGTHNGMKAKEDVYIWKIKVKDKVSHEKKEFYGHINLLR